MKTLLLSAITYATNPENFTETIAPSLLPDAIRMYTKDRERTHFEMSSDGKEVSYMRYPDTMQLSPEFMEQWMGENSALSSNVIKCSIGEKAYVETFKITNEGVAEPIYSGVLNHLVQDCAFDDFIRECIDCSDKYNEKYYFNNEELNGPEVRKLIDDIDNQCLCIVAKDIYERYGITINQGWFDNNVKPSLDADYNPEMAECTYKYMKLDPILDKHISEHEYSYINEGPLAPEVCEQFIDDLMKELDKELNIEQEDIER